MSDAPEFQLFERGPLLLVRWRRPTIEASARLARAIEQRAKTQGHKLFFAAIIGVDCPAPSQAVRDVLVADYQRSYAHCEVARMVILGSGMGRALVRSVLAGMGLATGLRGKGFAVDGSIRELAEAAERAHGTRASELVAELRAAELLGADES